LLIVIGLIALLSAITFGSLRGLKQSNTMAAANRQLLDDLAYARQRAIVNRTEVFMVFMPPADAASSAQFTSLSVTQKNDILRRQLTSYALFAKRTVGNQPGQETPRYLTDWRTLPEGVFIPLWKFVAPRTDVAIVGAGPISILPFQTHTELPVPEITGVTGVDVPFIGFNPQGRLLQRDPPVDEEIIPLARGKVSYPKDAPGVFAWIEPTPTEDPLNNSIATPNLIRIDWLTGRARVDRPEIQ
jgi:hypothetical protein